MKPLLLLAPLALAPLALAAGRAHARKRGTERIVAGFVKADANHDRMLTAEEAKGLPVLSARFAEVDADRDGKVTLGEVFAAMNARRAKLKAADHDHDGKYNRDEARDLPRLAKHFDEIDLDRDGFVTREEVRAYRMAKRDAVVKADLDGDHRLSRDEAARVPELQAAFDRIDADHDGQLTRDELRAWRARQAAAEDAAK
jgi:Ca2+-binding EF-hand superfamily protein